MAITIAIIGRPNVGKSTMFNRLTQTRDALVADLPGVTRDRQYGPGHYNGQGFVVIDTGGLYDINEANKDISSFISEQALLAAQEADAIFWMLDGKEGITAIDENLANELRPDQDKLYLLINKVEGLAPHEAVAEFHQLGIAEPFPVSAKRGDGVSSLLETVLQDKQSENATPPDIPEGLRISVIGRPNVGKSTLINRIVGEERLLTYAQPGTTRDSIAVPFNHGDKDYVLIDTAGVRRRAKVNESIEKFSVVKTLGSIDRAEIIILVMDAQEEIADQDLHLLGITAEMGKSLIIAVNKWDGIDRDQKQKIMNQIDRKLAFADYACFHYISALHGSGVGNIYKTIEKIHKSQSRVFKASDVTDILQSAVEAHQPPLVRGRRIKLRYAHIGGHNPIRVIIHGNQTERVPASYQRYLANTFRKQMRLTGTPVIVEFKKGDNPYKGRKNKLTPRQLARRKRVIKHAKRKGSL